MRRSESVWVCLSSSCHLSDFNGLLRHNRCHFKWNFIATSRNFYCSGTGVGGKDSASRGPTQKRWLHAVTMTWTAHCRLQTADHGERGEDDGGEGLQMRLWIRRNGNQIVAFKSKLMAAKLKEATIETPPPSGEFKFYPSTHKANA